MSEMNRTILVTGVTGKQGGAVARHLIDKGFAVVRGITRKPDSPDAQKLAELGVEIVQADLDDPASLEDALRGVWGVFSVQAAGDFDREVQEGTRLAQMAHDAGVEHFVYSSVGAADQKTGIPHFDSKARIEQAVRTLGFPGYTILRPVFFMENLLSPWVLQGDTLVLPLAPTTVLQMIAVDDIGKFGAMAFERPDKMNRAEIELAGDQATLPQAASVLSEALGRKITYSRMPIEQIRSKSPEMGLMFEWFDRVGYNVDIAGLESQYGIKLLKLPEWARQHAAVR